MPTYEELDLTYLNVDSVRSPRSILRADYGDGYADTARVGALGGRKSFTLSAGVWPDNDDQPLIGGDTIFEYYWSFFETRLDNGNEPFIIEWRDRKWLVDLANPQHGIDTHTSDLFTPHGIEVNMRRVSGVAFADDGSLDGPPTPTGLTLDYLSSTSLTASWDGPPDEEAPTVPVMTAASGITADTIVWNWNAATDNIAVTGYDLQVAEDAGFSVGLRTINLGNVLTYVDTPLSASTQYYARVRAHDAVPNNSAYSSSVNATTNAGLLLDTLGLTAKLAYGLRKLRAAYAGSCLRLRRASDNAEQDIGFSGDDLDWAAAISFKGASTVTVVLWYDQSGSAKNLDALADAREPLLDTSANVVVFDGTDDLMRAVSVDLSGTGAVSLFWAGKFNTLSGTDRAISIGDSNPLAELYSNSTLIIAQQDGSNNKTGTADMTARVFSVVADRSQAGADDTKMYFSSTEQTSTTDSTNVTGNFASCNVGMGEKGGDPTGDISGYEFILFASAVSAPNRATAVADMEAYYGL